MSYVIIEILLWCSTGNHLLGKLVLPDNIDQRNMNSQWPFTQSLGIIAKVRFRLLGFFTYLNARIIQFLGSPMDNRLSLIFKTCELESGTAMIFIVFFFHLFVCSFFFCAYMNISIWICLMSAISDDLGTWYVAFGMWSLPGLRRYHKKLIWTMSQWLLLWTWQGILTCL